MVSEQVTELQIRLIARLGLQLGAEGQLEIVALELERSSEDRGGPAAERRQVQSRLSS